MKYGNIKRAASVALFIVMTVGLGPVFSSLSCRHARKQTRTPKMWPRPRPRSLMAGRPARIFVQRNWKDTTELQGLLLEARSRQSKYRMAGKGTERPGIRLRHLCRLSAQCAPTWPENSTRIRPGTSLKKQDK